MRLNFNHCIRWAYAVNYDSSTIAVPNCDQEQNQFLLLTLMKIKFMGATENV